MVASAISDETVLEAGNDLDVLLYGVFSDAGGDALTLSAGSSDTAAATVSVTSDYGTLTVTGVAEGTTTITVTARDADGNRASDAFDVSVVKAPEPDPPQEPERTPQEKYAAAYNSRGYAYALLGDYESAIEDHDEAVRLEPGYERTRFGRQAFQLLSDRYDSRLIGCLRSTQVWRSECRS